MHRIKLSNPAANLKIYLAKLRSDMLTATYDVILYLPPAGRV